MDANPRFVQRLDESRELGVKAAYCFLNRLRHTYATWLINAGADVKDILSVMRHADIMDRRIFCEVQQKTTLTEGETLV